MELLIAALKDGRTRWDAADALVTIGAPAVEPLIAALKDPDLLARQGAAAALFEIQDSHATNAGRPALRPEIDREYMFLINWGSPGSEDVLIRALNRSGEKGMAVEFLNCGNPSLGQAAHDWAASHSYRIVSAKPDFAPLGWGSRRR